MLRIQLARYLTLGAALMAVGCSSWFNSCNDRPGFFSRFRTASMGRPVVISSGDCCDRGVSGPYLPPTQPGVLPAPTPNGNIPRIDENAKEMPWDPNKKMVRPSGTKTGNETRANRISE